MHSTPNVTIDGTFTENPKFHHNRGKVKADLAGVRNKKGKRGGRGGGGSERQPQQQQQEERAPKRVRNDPQQTPKN